MPNPIIQPRPTTQRTTHWGELKRCRSLNLTDTAWELITKNADAEGCNRSELIERIIRKHEAQMVDELNRPR